MSLGYAAGRLRWAAGVYCVVRFSRYLEIGGLKFNETKKCVSDNRCSTDNRGRFGAEYGARHINRTAKYADLTADSPWQVPDATISYAYYGNLYPEPDVDYFTFEASAGQSVLLSLSIPAIDGQEDFAPVMAVFGPGLDMDTLEVLASSV